MTVGVEFYNGAGNLLLTNLIKNPMVRAAGSTATVTNDLFGAGGGSKLEVAYTNASAGSHPLFFVNGDVTGFSAGMVKVSNTFTFRWWISAAVGTSVPWVIFDEMINTYGNIGIEIYADAAGLPMIFGMNTAVEPLRVEDVIDQTTTTGHTYGSSGRTYAMGQGNYAGEIVWEAGARVPGGLPDPDYYAKIGYADTIARSSSRTFNFSTKRLDPATSLFDGTPAPDFGEERFWHRKVFMIADVTGY